MVWWVYKKVGILVLIPFSSFFFCQCPITRSVKHGTRTICSCAAMKNVHANRKRRLCERFGRYRALKSVVFMQSEKNDFIGGHRQ